MAPFLDHGSFTGRFLEFKQESQRVDKKSQALYCTHITCASGSDEIYLTSLFLDMPLLYDLMTLLKSIL